jgi:two-component system chemotaxis sensor kinase CheA
METREYFRIEATELISRMTTGLRSLVTGDESAAEIPWRDLMRAAHTLKGAAHVVREKEMAATAHALEDALQQRSVALATQHVDALAEYLERIFAPQSLPVAPEPSGSVTTTLTSKPEEPRVETVRVELRSTDAVLQSVAECMAELTSLRELTGDIAELESGVAGVVQQLRSGAVSRALAAAEEIVVEARVLRLVSAEVAARIRRKLSDTERLTTELRLAPAEPMLLRVERTARHTAEAAGIEIECILRGGEERVDLHILSAAEEALMHMARNAVTHGLQGKVHGGCVEIAIERHGAAIDFVCTDNGHGLDPERLRSLAVQRGWMSPGEAKLASRETLVELLTRPGVTTHLAVDESAGRGIGLDVVNATAQKLRGQLLLHSAPQGGTRVVLRLPESLFSLPCLVMSLGEEQVAIPISHVEQTISLQSHRTRKGNQEGIFVEGMQLAEVDFATLLSRDKSLLDNISNSKTAVVIRKGVSLVALMVERVVGIEELVTERVPYGADVPQWVAGTYRDAEGRPRLLVDPSLLQISEGSAVSRLQEERKTLPILVIDDSLTSRRLEESILSSAGYEVHTAISAEEGLELARERSYGLYLVDVEMPGIDGFEFVRITREDSILRKVPVVMVTSRNLPGDRERGLHLGAAEYIVKGDFDQERLLSAIAGLTKQRVQ